MPSSRYARPFPRGIAVVLALLCTAALPAMAQHAPAVPEWNLQALMAAMRQVRSSTTRFVETKYFHLLNQPQRSSGQLTYVAPGYLRKQTTEPTAARLTINGDSLTIEQQGRPAREISLRDYSEIGALVESVRATLAGDLPTLNRYFTTALTGSADGWTLTLKPREASPRKLVAEIRIEGVRGAISDVQTTEADGDRTDMAVIADLK